jgi:protein ImuB
MTEDVELYAAIFAREFPAQALLRLRNELRGQPCVVMEGEPPLQEAASLNAKAQALGIVHGMTQVEIDTFPNVTVLRRSHSEEAAARTVLLECAGGFSARIEDLGEDRVFLCVIDIAGTEKLFGPPEALARSLLTRIGALGITACVAVSGNLHAAVALAKGLSPRTTEIIPPGDEGIALASLPLTVLDLAEEQAETFSLWGIRTLGAMAELPEKGLIARMGHAGKRLRQLARGELSQLLQPVEPVFTLAEHMELDSPLELLDALMFVVNVMLEQLILRAKARVLALASITIRLTLEGGADHTCTVRPALSMNDRQLWIKLLHLELEAHPPDAAILAVALEAEPGSTSKVQTGLFSPPLPEPSRLDVTLARIRAIVGDGNVGRPVLKDTNQADGFCVEPFSIPSGLPSEITSGSLRPALRMLRPTEAALVTVRRQRPNTFVFRDHRYAVEHAYGPWLTSGEWWGSTLWGYEQWDLVARSQIGDVLCCCVVRDRMEDNWRMVALYD